MNRPIIGVIGGAGVAAGVELVSMLEIKMTSRGAFRDQHHPEVILFQATQAPSRSMYLEGRGNSFLPDYIEIGKKLKSIGASFLCMSCNTAHFSIEELEKEIQLPFIDIIKEVVLDIKNRYPQKINIGIMCSDGTKKVRLYDKYINLLLPHVNLIYPNQDYQNCITQGICNIKKGLHRFSPIEEDTPQYLFHKAANHLAQNGAELIIEGCTEIPLALSETNFHLVPLINSIDVLAEACLNKYLYLLKKDKDIE